MRMDEQVPAAGIDDDPALVLDAGVPYVPDWAEAQRALEVLLVELARCGLGGRLPYARAEVTAYRSGWLRWCRTTSLASGRRRAPVTS